MSKEAMKLALEALEAADWYINQLEITLYSADDAGTHEDRLKVQQAITVMRLEIDALNMASKPALAEQPAQQEYASFAEWAHDYVQDNLHKLKPARQLVDCHATGVCVQSGLRAEQPAQQEPVAWMVDVDLANYQGQSEYRTILAWNAKPVWSGTHEINEVLKAVPLYTSPQPAQRTWVGLFWGELPEDGQNHDFLRGAVWAETKLKEKNQ